MIPQKRIDSMSEEILSQSPADQTEILLQTWDSYLTRFSNNQIHQNVAEENAKLSIRVVLDGKIGSASTNILKENYRAETLQKAVQIAKSQRKDPHFKSLPTGGKYTQVETFDEKTASFTPDQRANVANTVIKKASEAGFSAAGAFSTGIERLTVINSLGVNASADFTTASLNIVVNSPAQGSGYANSFSRKAGQINSEQMAEQAVEKCRNPRSLTEIKPGEYTVILEPYAVGEMLAFLGYLGLGALSFQEGRSFVCGKIGEKVTGDNINVWDDALDERGLPMPFDFEGMPKSKVSLIKNGIARGVVYDSYTGGKEEKDSTGHALPAPNPVGPLPLNLFLKNGESKVEDMIGSTSKGVYVTRFWYTNSVEPVSTTITGMTRDGTFLIENGEITRPLKNLRFTESILRAFSHVSMVSRKCRLVKGRSFVSCFVPALKVEGFNFTGTTE